MVKRVINRMFNQNYKVMPTTKNTGNSSRENDSNRKMGSQSSQSNTNRGKENRNSGNDMNRQGGQIPKTNK